VASFQDNNLLAILGQVGRDHKAVVTTAHNDRIVLIDCHFAFISSRQTESLPAIPGIERGRYRIRTPQSQPDSRRGETGTLKNQDLTD
jgi:hypothetical protein